jgi:hypothetical protein
VQAEWLLVVPRLMRTRFGVSLLLLAGALAWLETHGVDSRTIALLAGALAAVIGAEHTVGHSSDRAAIAVALTHPTTPLAVATGRWLGAVIPASLVACLWATGSGAGLDAAIAGSLAAAAVGGCALVVSSAAGAWGAAVLFLIMAAAGAVPPERIVNVAAPGFVRLAAASALELGPALWHYRDATRDIGALLHAVAWACLGVLLAAAVIGRRRIA